MLYREKPGNTASPPRLSATERRGTVWKFQPQNSPFSYFLVRFYSELRRPQTDLEMTEMLVNVAGFNAGLD
jgi:hypothetical protein